MATTGDLLVQGGLVCIASGPRPGFHRCPKPGNHPGINLISFGQDAFGADIARTQVGLTSATSYPRATNSLTSAASYPPEASTTTVALLY